MASVAISGVMVVSSNRGLLLISEEVVSWDVVVPCVTVLASSEVVSCTVVPSDTVLVSSALSVVSSSAGEVEVSVKLSVVVSETAVVVSELSVVVTELSVVVSETAVVVSELAVVVTELSVVASELSVVVSELSVLVEDAHSGKSSQLTRSDSLPPRHFPSGPGSTRRVRTFWPPLPQVAEQADQSLHSDHLHWEVVGSTAVALTLFSSRQSFPSSASLSLGGHVQT